MALGSLAKVHLRSGRLNEARVLLDESLRIFRELGDCGGEAWALDALGDLHYAQECFVEACKYYQRAVPVFQEIYGRVGEADARLGLGKANAALGLVDEAMECFVDSLRVFQESGLPPKEARTLWSMGMLFAREGDQAGAKAVWQRAFAIFHELDLPEADQVRALL